MNAGNPARRKRSDGCFHPVNLLRAAKAQVSNSGEKWTAGIRSNFFHSNSPPEKVKKMFFRKTVRSEWHFGKSLPASQNIRMPFSRPGVP
jgi:hypothetical protein